MKEKISSFLLKCALSHTRSCMVGVLIVLGAFIAIVPFLSGRSLWKGYYMVLLDNDGELEQTVQRLQNQGFPDLLSSVTGTVRINVFSSLEEVRIEDLRERLQDEDPRRDGFIQKVGKLFQTEPAGKPVLLFPARHHPLLFYVKLAKLLEGSRWKFADWNPYRAGGTLLVFMAFTFLQVLSSKRQRYLRVFLSVPWVPLVLQGDLIAFGFSVLFYHVLSRYVEHLLPEIEQYLSYQRTRGFRLVSRGAGRQFALMGFLLLAIAPSGLILGTLYGSFFTLFLGLFLVLKRTLAVKDREHRIFVPLSILPGFWDKEKEGFRYGSLALLVLLPLLWLSPGPETHLKVPSPEPNGFFPLYVTRNAIKDLWVLHRGDPLPNISDFIVHLKYQRDMPFGATFDFPSQDEVLEYPRFKEEGGKLRLYKETMVRYDHSWYKQMVGQVQADKVGRLLYNQGPRAILWVPLSSYVPGRALFSYYLLVFVFTMVILKVRISLVHRPTPWLVGIFTRRKQQEA